MPNPFGLLVRGLTVATAWWLIVTGMAVHGGMEPFDGLGVRGPAWLAGVLFAVLAVLTIHFRQKSQVSASLRPGSFYGLNVSIGGFPSPVSTGRAVLPALVEQWLSASFPIEGRYREALGAITALLDAERVANALNDCRRVHQGLANFVYDGVPMGNIRIPARAKGFALDPLDPLIPILGFTLKLGQPGLHQKVLSLHAVRLLPFPDQHTLTQVLAGLESRDRMPLMRDRHVKAGLSVRDDRTAALLMLLTPFQPQPELAAATMAAVTSSVSPIFQRLYDLLHEPGRINGQKQNERLGFLHGERLYLHWHLLLETLGKSLSPSAVNLTTPDIAEQLLQTLVEKDLLVTSLQDQSLKTTEARFKVVFTGKIGDREHRNEFNEMVILLWRTHFPLMARLRNSRFSPEVMGQSSPMSPPTAPRTRATVGPNTTAAGLTIAPASAPSAAREQESVKASGPTMPDLPSGPPLRAHIAALLDAMMQDPANGPAAPVRRNTDSEGRVWLYVSLAAIREGLLAGITEAHLRALIAGDTPGVICLKNQKQKRIYGFCLDAMPAEDNAPDAAG